ALPPRPPVASNGVAEAPSRTAARIESTKGVDSLADHGAALVGVMFDRAPGDAEAWVAGELAARALSPRVRAALAGDLAISNEARALWMPINGWRGFSLLYTPVVTTASRLDEAASAVWAEYTRLAREGLAQIDLEEARESLRRSIAAELERPEAWAEAL